MRYEALGSAIESAVRNACEGKEVGVVFSGGMDSGLIAALAKNCARSVICYTCGNRGPEDRYIRAARGSRFGCCA